MGGGKSGYITSQGFILSQLLVAQGYTIHIVSKSHSRWVRLWDIAWTLFKRSQYKQIVVIEIYMGRSLIVEDIASWMVKYLSRKQTVLMVLHGGDIPVFMARFPHWSCRVLRRADVIVAPSNYLIAEVSEYGFEVKLIPNVINLARYPYRHRDRISATLIWMRSFHPIYNPLMALNCLVYVKDRYPEVRLIMAGADKGLLSEMQSAAKEMGLENNIEFPGFLEHTGKIEQFSRADIFITTSHIDNMPVAAVEAAAFGLPIVAAEVGGIPYLLKHEETGLLVPDDDAQAMAEQVCRLVENSELVSRLSINGRALAEKSSWETVHKQWEDMFEQALMTIER
jgi:glycosyltransferase involved in cell wall biosynthesis